MMLLAQLRADPRRIGDVSPIVALAFACLFAGPASASVPDSSASASSRAADARLQDASSNAVPEDGVLRTRDSGLVALPHALVLSGLERGGEIFATSFLVNTSLVPIEVTAVTDGKGRSIAASRVPFWVDAGAVRAVDLAIGKSGAASAQTSAVFHTSWGKKISQHVWLTTGDPAGATPRVNERRVPPDQFKPFVAFEDHATGEAWQQVPADARFESVVWIVNPTSEPRVISRIKPGCSCTEVTGAPPREIAARSALPLRLRIHAENESDRGKDKRITVYVTFEGVDEPAKDSLDFRILAPGDDGKRVW